MYIDFIEFVICTVSKMIPNNKFTQIYNEPHDVMNYNGGGQYQWNDWIQWVEETSELILAEGVNWLIGVQGTNHDCSLRSGSADNNWYDVIYILSQNA